MGHGIVWCACLSLILATVGCGRDDRPAGRDAGGGADSGAALDAGGPGGDAGGGDAGGGDDDAGGGGEDDAGTVAMECSSTTMRSPCGDQSIVRVVAALGAGMGDMTGDLVVNLHHYRLGMGSSGGVIHTRAEETGVSIGPSTPAEVHFDHCDGGEMWSEDNCEYNLWVYLDTNGNDTLDPGEPAGRKLFDLSCRATGPACDTLVLDCLDGMSCAAFTDPGPCSCASPTCEGAGSPSRIVTCS